MDPAAGLRFLTELTETERRKYVDQIRVIGGFVLVGLALIAAGSTLTRVLVGDYWKWLLTLGGGFVATLPSLRLNELYSSKARVGALVQLRAEYERASAPFTDVSADERAKLTAWVEKLYEKTLGL